MVSTPTGPPSRGRLALALTAAAAAAAPASAPAAPVARSGQTSSDTIPSSGRAAVAPRVARAPVGSAATVASSARPGPVIVEYAIRPAAVDAGSHDVESVLGDESWEGSAALAAPVELELLKLTRAGAGSRLAVAVDEPGLLRLTWTADGMSGTARQQLRPGRHELRLTTPPRATHVRVHATYESASGGQSAATHGAFRLRAS